MSLPELKLNVYIRVVERLYSHVLSPFVDLYRNMQAELVLLLPEQDTRKRSRGSVFTVILYDEDSGKQRNLFASFLRKAKGWKHKRCAPQLREIQLLPCRYNEKVSGLTIYQMISEKSQRRLLVWMHFVSTAVSVAATLFSSMGMLNAKTLLPKMVATYR